MSARLSLGALALITALAGCSAGSGETTVGKEGTGGQPTSAPMSGQPSGQSSAPQFDPSYAGTLTSKSTESTHTSPHQFGIFCGDPCMITGWRIGGNTIALTPAGTGRYTIDVPAKAPDCSTGSKMGSPPLKGQLTITGNQATLRIDAGPAQHCDKAVQTFASTYTFTGAQE